MQRSRGDTYWVMGIAAAAALIHVLTNGGYGFHRDELQFLSDARHMDWGFVAYPPLTPLVERISMALFGLSMVGLRMASVVAQAAAVIATGAMARDLGGGRQAQVTAALAVALSPLPLFEGTEFQYTSFDFLWWVLIAWFVVKLLKTENPRWWLAIGAAMGIGLETKYSIAFFIAGVLGGVLLTEARRYLASRWFWIGMALGVAISLPNLIWQAQHDFISYHFLQHIHARDVAEGRAKGFLMHQLIIGTNPMAVFLWVGGLVAFLRNRRYRMLAWMYLIPLALFWAARGRDYYLGAAYPMLLAMGAAAGERWVAAVRVWRRRTIETVFCAGLAVCGAYAGVLIVPLASSGPLRDFALSHNGDLREEFGWKELARTVAGIRDSLPAEERRDYGVLVGNYGEQGAIEILGPAWHLPPPISVTNSAWLRGYPEPPPTTLIVVGVSNEDAAGLFTSCRVAGHNGGVEGIRNEESIYHPDILVCGPPREPWPEFWKKHLRFG